MSIVEAFPNITWLTCSARKCEANEGFKRVLSAWCYLEAINGTNCTDIVRAALSSLANAAHLKSISLQYNNRKFYNPKPILSNADILLDVSSLENAPKLELLKLSGSQCISYQVLTGIHETVQNLYIKSLKLYCNSAATSRALFYPQGTIAKRRTSKRKKASTIYVLKLVMTCRPISNTIAI